MATLVSILGLLFFPDIILFLLSTLAAASAPFFGHLVVVLQFQLATIRGQ